MLATCHINACHPESFHVQKIAYTWSKLSYQRPITEPVICARPIRTYGGAFGTKKESRILTHTWFRIFRRIGRPWQSLTRLWSGATRVPPCLICAIRHRLDGQDLPFGIRVHLCWRINDSLVSHSSAREDLSYWRYGYPSRRNEAVDRSGNYTRHKCGLVTGSRWQSNLTHKRQVSWATSPPGRGEEHFENNVQSGFLSIEGASQGSDWRSLAHWPE